MSIGSAPSVSGSVRAWQPEDLPIVGLALREEKKLVDKITKGAKMHN